MIRFINKLIIIDGMGIVSVSLNDKILKDINRLEKDLGFSGRSEVIRAGVRLLINEEKSKSKLNGVVNGVILVVNQENYNEEISKIRHEYKDIIKTQIHNHFESYKCLQVFIIKGVALKVKNFIMELETCKKTDYVKFFLS
jgi:CopG family transcriptional regulator, nickel-responsive regulator